MIEISAVICTYERPATLKKALASLTAQTLDPSLYEIIVVDNYGSDSTAGIIRDFQEKYPGHSVIGTVEKRVGLAHARNTGAAAARGRYVAFMDDDAEADEGWLELALSLFSSVEPAPCCLGGPIFPLYAGAKPGWFQDRYEARTWGDEARWLNPGETFSGSNMIFEKGVISRHGGFDVTAGMSGARIAVGEETALFNNIRRAQGDGKHFYYSPQLVVSHLVPQDKTTVAYQLKRAFATGRSENFARRRTSLLSRVRMSARHLLSILKFTAAAPFNRGSGPARAWLVDAFRPVAVELGGLSACLGLPVSINQNAPSGGRKEARVITRLKRKFERLYRERVVRKLGLVEVAPNYAFFDRLSPADTAVDVGVGDDPDFSKYLIERYGVACFAVDPTRRHAPALKRVEETLPAFHYLPLALGPDNGPISFFESLDNISGSVHQNHRNVVNDRTVSYEVEMVSLKKLLQIVGSETVALMKIDVEGSEYALVETADPADLKKIEQLIIEFHHGTITEYSEKHTRRAIKRLRGLGMKSVSYNGRDCLFYW